MIKNKSKYPEHNIWHSAISRCKNKNNISYKFYGGRGISMSDEWASSFETFFSDMGQRPSNKHSLDRIDNNRGYEKGNCRWATRKEQARNTRACIILEYNGIKGTLKALCEHFGVKYTMAISRKTHGWPLDKILTIPAGKRLKTKKV